MLVGAVQGACAFLITPVFWINSDRILIDKIQLAHEYSGHILHKPFSAGF
jgi:hypothetical protein